MLSCAEEQHTNKKDVDFSEKGEAFFNRVVSEEETTTKTDEKNKRTNRNALPNKEKVEQTTITNTTSNYIESINQKNDLYEKAKKDLFLAATKLCQGFDYEKTFGYERSGYGKQQWKNGDTKIIIDNHCSAFVPPPYVAPIEYYYKLFHAFDQIEKNKNNSFKLKEIRQDFYQQNKSDFQELLNSINPENLVSYNLASANIQEYDFETKRLRLSIRLTNNLKITNYNGGILANVRQIAKKSFLSTPHYIQMSENEAKKIFDYYDKRGDKGTPFRLFCKTTYRLQAPSYPSRQYRLEALVKKIEFFKEFDALPKAEFKIGEVLIDNKPI